MDFRGTGREGISIHHSNVPSTSTVLPIILVVKREQQSFLVPNKDKPLLA